MFFYTCLKKKKKSRTISVDCGQAVPSIPFTVRACPLTQLISVMAFKFVQTNDKLFQFFFFFTVFMFLFDYIVISCGVLETPRFGRKSNFWFVPNTKVTFECNQEFVLIGDQRRSCSADGKWDIPEYGYTECLRKYL